MKIRKLPILLGILLLSNPCKSQNLDRQEIKLASANIIFGGVSTGLGAVINKQKSQKVLPTFWKGFKAGCLGGTLLFVGKKCTNAMYNDKEITIWGGWGSKIIHNAGASIMENAALHRPAFSHYNLYIGFTRLEFDWQNRFRFHPKIMPLTLAAMIYGIYAYDDKLDLKKSLTLGTPVFIADRKPEGGIGLTFRGNISVYYDQSIDPDFYHSVYAHENVHTLQGQEYYIFNTYLNRPVSKFKSSSKLINSISQYVYVDLSMFDFTYTLAKYIATKKCDCTWRNPYEFEAERMARGYHLDMSLYCR